MDVYGVMRSATSGRGFSIRIGKPTNFAPDTNRGDPARNPTGYCNPAT